MFRGTITAKVDEKGRLKLPAAFKQLYDAQHETQFYITSTDGSCAEIWALSEWEKIEAQLAEFSLMDDAVAKFLKLTSYYGQQVEIDNQARVLLPQLLRGAAKLDSEVAVMGKINHLEVYNHASLEQSLPDTALTPDDRKTVMARLSRRSET
jgi:MraZ protein